MSSSTRRELQEKKADGVKRSATRKRSSDTIIQENVQTKRVRPSRRRNQRNTEVSQQKEESELITPGAEPRQSADHSAEIILEIAVEQWVRIGGDSPSVRSTIAQVSRHFACGHLTSTLPWRLSTRLILDKQFKRSGFNLSTIMLRHLKDFQLAMDLGRFNKGAEVVAVNPPVRDWLSNLPRLDHLSVLVHAGMELDFAPVQVTCMTIKSGQPAAHFTDFKKQRWSKFSSLTLTCGNITKLTLKDDFNRSFFNISLPISLLELELGDSFDYPLDGLLPPYLRKLCIGNSEGALYNMPLDALPEPLQELAIRGDFNLPLNALPSFLRTLRLPMAWSHPLRNLPATLETVALGRRFGNSLAPLPEGIKHLRVFYTISGSLSKLPSCLSSLEVIGAPAVAEQVSLPDSVEHVIHEWAISNVFNIPSEKSQLASIIYRSNLMERQEDSASPTSLYRFLQHLPPMLTELALPHWYNDTVQKLPPSLRSLTFGAKYNSAPANLPSSLRVLRFESSSKCRSEFNKSLGRLPSTLEVLEIQIPSAFNQPLTVNLPSSVKVLMMGNAFTQAVEELPSALQELHIHRGLVVPKIPSTVKVWYY